MNDELSRSYRPHTAVVVGASLAGMLAAHVVSRRFERVIMLERGEPAVGTAPRRSVPQERHVHLLLQRGKAVLESLFPGFLAQLEAHGAVVADASRDVHWYHRRRWKRRFESGILTHYCSRALVDHVVRERIRANPRIELRSDTRVTGLLREASRPFVTGVITASSAGSDSVHAELVIDASGRGSQAGPWLRALGATPVRVSEVLARLSYGTRIYKKLPEYDAAWKVLLVFPKAPASRRMGVISPIEGGRWMVTTGGWLGDCPGSTEHEFLEFLRGLPHPAIHDVIRRAHPLSDVAIHKIPGGIRRHFEEVVDWPGRFLVLGDAVCSLNPIYSQGMTVGALEVETLAAGLEDLLAAGGNPEATRALQRKIVAQVDVPWSMAQTEDLRFPEVEGARGWRLTAQHVYGDLLAEASSVDEVVMQRVLRVSNLLEAPERLFERRFQARVLLAAVRAQAVGASR